MIKIATWNVNSIKARLDHLLRWLSEASPDIVLLQETKSKNENFPHQQIEDAGYHSAHHGQPAYNGVAILSKQPQENIIRGNPHRSVEDPQARLIAATISGVRVLSAYIPNGQSIDSEKYHYKLSWLADYATYLQTLSSDITIAGGDYNIAPTDEDIYDPADWGEDILTSPRERQALQTILDTGYTDAHQQFQHDGPQYTWWDYRAAAFRRNRGLRIDLMLTSEKATKKTTACHPDKEPRKWDRPSDHTPVVLTLET